VAHIPHGELEADVGRRGAAPFRANFGGGLGRPKSNGVTTVATPFQERCHCNAVSRKIASRHGVKPPSELSVCERIKSAIARLRAGLPEGDVDRFGSRLGGARPFHLQRRCLSERQRVTSLRDSVTACDGVPYLGIKIVPHGLDRRPWSRRQVREHPAPVPGRDLELVVLEEDPVFIPIELTAASLAFARGLHPFVAAPVSEALGLFISNTVACLDINR
jgi:hypothetical protein